MSKQIGKIAMERLKALATEKDFNVSGSQLSTWQNGYYFGVSDIYTKLWMAKQRMLDAYSQALTEADENEAYHSALAVMALEVDMIIQELKPRDE